MSGYVRICYGKSDITGHGGIYGALSTQLRRNGHTVKNFAITCSLYLTTLMPLMAALLAN